MSPALDDEPESEFPEPDSWPTWTPFTRGKYSLSYDPYYRPSTTTDETTETQEEEKPAKPASGDTTKNP
jgi:hypothetical protein